MDSEVRRGVPIRGFHLFTLFGFEVKLDLSWLLLALLISWSLGAGWFPARYPDLSVHTYAWMGISVAVGVFFSIVFHEFSHSVVARYYGMPIRGITLFIFGGGICLGLAMASSGAASYFAHLFFPLVEGRGWLVLLGGVCVFGALVTNAMANVAAAALILPIVIPLAQLEGVDPRVLALGLACATSFAMILVIGCPPNAIAYSYRQFSSFDLTRAGLVATPVLLLLLLVTAGIWWSVLGLL